MKQDHFSKFEDRIQHLIEGGFARLFSGQLHPQELALQLAKTMEDDVFRSQNNQSIAPDTYCIRLCPQDHDDILSTHPDVVTELASALVEIARMADVSLVSSPQVKLLADKTMELHCVCVDAWHSAECIDSTQSMHSSELSKIADEIPPGAMLVLNGTQHIPIDRSVLNLGRQRDNHIIINDPTVSRYHAQLRLRFGQYVLFDLGSVSGTTVNGHRTQEVVLQSGDVITLGNSKLIYIEDNDNPDIPTDRLPPTKE